MVILPVVRLKVGGVLLPICQNPASVASKGLLLLVVLSQTALLGFPGLDFLVKIWTWTQYLVQTSRLDRITRSCLISLMLLAYREQQRSGEVVGLVYPQCPAQLQDSPVRREQVLVLRQQTSKAYELKSP